jgi:hypothetical protein
VAADDGVADVVVGAAAAPEARLARGDMDVRVRVVVRPREGDGARGGDEEEDEAVSRLALRRCSAAVT